MSEGTSTERQRDNTTQQVLLTFAEDFPDREELEARILDIHSTQRVGTPFTPDAVGVFAVGRRPVVNGALIGINYDDIGNPGGLPETADLEYGIMMTDVAIFDASKLEGAAFGFSFLVCGTAHYAKKVAPPDEEPAEHPQSLTEHHDTAGG